MILLIASPEKFAIYDVDKSKRDPKTATVAHKVLIEKTPPENHNNIYNVFEIETIEGINWDDVMKQLYSSDEDTRVLIEDTIKKQDASS